MGKSEKSIESNLLSSCLCCYCQEHLPENKLLVAREWLALAVSTVAEVIVLCDITTLPTAKELNLRDRRSSEFDELLREKDYIFMSEKRQQI